MRNYTILPALAAALLAAACDNDNLDNDPKLPGASAGTIPVAVTAGTPASDEVGTRTVIDIDLATKTFATRWSDQDQMTVSYTYGGGAGSGDVPFTYDEASGLFRSELPDYTGAWTYDAFMPHRAVSPKSAEFGNLRTQRGNDFNYAYDPLVAEPIATTNAAPGKDDAGGELAFAFTRLTSIVKVRITGGNAGDKIRTVLLTATDGQPISSTAFDANGLATTETDGVSPQSNVIAMQFETGTQPGADLAEAYFNIPAGTYNRLQVDVVTEDGRIAGRVVNGDVAAIAGDVTLLNLENLVFRKVADYAQLQPTLEWPGQDMNAVHDITVGADGALTYDAAITIEAPAGIAGLWVNVTSDVLNGTDQDGDGIKDGITRLDLFNETTIAGTIAYSGLGLDCFTQVQYKKSTIFNITGLIPLINSLGPAPEDLHTFEVHVTDLAGRETTQALTFRTPIPDPSIAFASADAWTNTATLNLNDIPAAAQTVTVEYKTTTAAEWLPATVSEDRTTAAITPQWETYTTADWVTPNTVEPFYRIKPGTGVSRGNTYQCRMTIDGKVYEGSNFNGPTTQNPAFDSLTNGDLHDSTCPCYKSTASNKLHASEWWCSGNNDLVKTSFIGGTVLLLCDYDSTYDGAHLVTRYTKVFTVEALAAGNLFTGQFNMGAMDGTVQFGQKYNWKARPKAVKVRYDAKIGTVDFRKYEAASGFPIEQGVRDYARIFVAIVDWGNTRNVNSGTKAPTGMWDPETATEPADTATYGGGKIIAYASKWIQQEALTGSLQIEELPINYYDKNAKPTSGNYSIVVSCSSNAYGDYMCGCKSNEMYIGDFEWVY